MTEPMCFIIHPHVPETEQGGRNRLGKSCCMLLNKESIQKAHKGILPADDESKWEGTGSS